MMKRISAVMVGMLFASAALAEEAQPFDPNFSEMTEIRIMYNRWTGIFWPSGEVMLKKLIEFKDECEVMAPPRTFSFEEIYVLVAPHLKPAPVPGPKPADALGITFYFRDTEPDRKRFYIEDQQVIRTLMHGVRDNALPWPPYDENMAQAERVFSRHPLVPGDEPTPFKYDEETWRIARETVIALKKMPGAVTNDESKEEAIRIHLEIIQEHNEKLSKRKLPTAMQNEGRAKPSRRTADGETGIEDNASDGSPGTASPYLCVGILSALCVGAVLWFIRKRR